jgi:hypothetical protein
MAEVAAAAEEAAEEVEGVVVVGRAAAAALALPLLEPFVAVLVVDFALVRVRERLVRLRYLDEFLVGGLVAGVLVRVVSFREGAVGALDVAFGGFAVDPEELGGGG